MNNRSFVIFLSWVILLYRSCYAAQAQFIAELVVSAREQAQQVASLEQGDILSATLTHCADVLDKKWFPGALTYDRRKRTEDTLQRLLTMLRDNTWNADALRGLHQWARISNADGSVQPFALYVPETYDAAKQYGLIIVLSGVGGDEYRMVSDLAQAKPEDFFIVSPFSRGSAAACEDIWVNDVFELFDLLHSRFMIDSGRLYATGQSQGGKRSWCLGQAYPERFAAIAVFAGWTDPEAMFNMRTLPVLVVHGANDSGGTSAEHARKLVRRLQALNAPVRYEELPDVGHGAWSAYLAQHGAQELLEYFRAHAR